MLKCENTEVFNFEGALRGMRNPLNSWDKSNSYYDIEEDPAPVNPNDWVIYRIGENDLALAQKLIRAGSDHRKFMRQIFVSVDITAPLYWWKEFDTYKVGTVANSCSTMHTIHKRPLTWDDFSVDEFNFGDNLYLDTVYGCKSIDACFADIIAYCNNLRDSFLKTNDKRYWRALIQLLPESYNQRRTVTMNYENLRNMYYARKNHKLTEWSVDFVAWIDTLPYANELIKI